MSLDGARWVRRAFLVLAMTVALVASGVVPASARVGAANWTDLDRTPGCSIALRIPVVDPYHRVYDWYCNVYFEAVGTECSLVEAEAVSITGCEAKLGLSFVGIASRIRTDDGRRAWQCTAVQTNASFYFYDGYSGRGFANTNTQVEVKAGQADTDPEGQTVNTVSTGTYNGSLIYNGGFGTLNYYGTFLLDCNRSFTGEGHGFVGQLLLEEAP